VILVEQWEPADGMELEPNALTAVTETIRNLVVTAGPGAGKTELLAQRADFLLRTGQCRYPRRILAISFKVDAAKNLKDRVGRRCPPELAARLDSYTFHAFAKRLIDAFRPVLTGVNALDVDYTIGPERIFRRQIDFDAMAPLAAEILETSDVARAALRQTYSAVFLDEFQDCTTNQYNLLRAAFLGADVRLIAVGDVKQRIMRWAGALDGVLATFAADFSAHPLVLYLNFRAQPRLRRMQNAMVRVMEPDAALDDDQLAGEGGTVEVQQYPDSAAEASAVADAIQTWTKVDGVAPDEIAVLVAKQVPHYTHGLRSELRQRAVPFREENELQDLAAEPIAVLMLDFLGVVVGEREPQAWTRLMDAALGRRFDDDADDKPFSELRRAVSTARNEYIRNQHGTLRELLDRFLTHVGTDVLSGLAPQYQQGSRLEELIESVHTTLEDLVTKTGDVSQALREFTGRHAVKLMTVHKAKGLEFDRVIVLTVEHEMYWGDEQDERAAYFVAVSRARSVLWLTTAEKRPAPPGAPWNWTVSRRGHQEFLDYALTTA
jgi:superfamily I DNA/RNA helicase